MTGRDRMVLLCVVALVLLGAFYLKLVSPTKKEAAKLTAEISTANSQLSTAEGSLASARNAQSQYATAYASAVELGKAVPPAPEVSSLIFQLDAASQSKNVEFASITSGTGSGSGSSSSASSSASTPAASGGSFTQMPFTFNFEGDFSSLGHLLQTIEGFTRTTSSGLEVTGRLLTIQTLKLTAPSGNAVASAPKQMTGTIGATAYVLPSAAGATAPAPPSSGSSTSTTKGAPATSSPTTPAVAKVTP